MFGRRAVLHVIVALALLFTQQVLVAHPLAHLSQSVPAGSDESPLPHGKTCSLCLQASNAGDVLVAFAALLSLEFAQPVETAPAASHFVPPLLLAFFCRGPPALL